MNKIILGLKSRTVWSIILGYVVMAEPILPVNVKSVIGAVLVILGVVFKLYPSQNYTTPSQG